MKTKSSLRVTVLVALLASFGYKKAQAQGYQIGEVIADFRLKTTKGELKTLADLRGSQGVIVVFTANHCPFAKLYEDRLISLHNRYQARGFTVVAINANDPAQQPEDDFAKMQERAGHKLYPFAYLHDETQQVAAAFGATRTPEAFLLVREGDKLRLVYAGAIDNSPNEAAQATEKYLEHALDEVMAHRKVSRDNTKAVGCTIKWKE
jgi:peroxiredoxin